MTEVGWRAELRAEAVRAVPWVELAVSLVLLAAATLRVRDARTQALRHAGATAGNFVVGQFAIRDLSGLDATGAPVAVPRRIGRYAVFVVRAGKADADCAYWDEVAANLSRTTPRVQIVGFCMGPGCDRIKKRAHGFPLISFAEQVVARPVASLDLRGLVLLVDDHGRTLATFAWRKHPAADTAQRLENVARRGLGVGVPSEKQPAGGVLLGRGGKLAARAHGG